MSQHFSRFRFRATEDTTVALHCNVPLLFSIAMYRCRYALRDANVLHHVSRHCCHVSFDTTLTWHCKALLSLFCIRHCCCVLQCNARVNHCYIPFQGTTRVVCNTLLSCHIGCKPDCYALQSSFISTIEHQKLSVKSALPAFTDDAVSPSISKSNVGSASTFFVLKLNLSMVLCADV